MKYFFENIKRLIEWVPVLWNNHDFDQGYIYEVIIYKLRRSAKNMRDHGIIKNNEYYANRMFLCAELLERCENEYYEGEMFGFYTSSPFDVKGSLDIKSENFDEYFNLYPRDYKIALKKEYPLIEPILTQKEKYRIASIMCHNIQNKCQRIAFGILHKDINSWWW